jgi:hypothetical protein
VTEGPSTHRRWWPRLLLVVGLLGVTGGGLLWWDARQTQEISVDRAVDAFRDAQPTPSVPPAALSTGPPPGVYVYATSGSEGVSAGVTHTYPAETTLTVTAAGCGLQVRWDALDERWMQWQLCAADEGWRLESIVDLHKFLHVADRQELECDPDALLRAPGTFTCRGGDTAQAWRLAEVGTEAQQVGAETVEAQHVRATSSNTGPARNEGTIDLWLHPETGLPVRVVVRNRGSSEVLGATVTYEEDATFTLTSLTPQQ